MVNPISNDKIMPSANDKNRTSGNQQVGEEAQNDTTKPTSASEDTLRLSQAGRLANQGVAGIRRHNSIAGEDQARLLASRIREQIGAAGTGALSIHGRLESGQLTSLLESSRA